MKEIHIPLKALRTFPMQMSYKEFKRLNHTSATRREVQVVQKEKLAREREGLGKCPEASHPDFEFDMMYTGSYYRLLSKKGVKMIL